MNRLNDEQKDEIARLMGFRRRSNTAHKVYPLVERTINSLTESANTTLTALGKKKLRAFAKP